MIAEQVAYVERSDLNRRFLRLFVQVLGLNGTVAFC